MSRPLYPLFLKLEGRRVVVVGGGPVATSKAEELASHGADVHVVSPETTPVLAALARSVTHERFSAEHLEGAFLVVAAAPPAVNREVKAAADARAVFVVAVDDVESCSAFGAARLVRGGITIALSSSGAAPALVALLRRGIEAVLPDDLDAWREIAERARADWKGSGVPIAARRRLLLDALLARYESQGEPS